MSLKLPVIYVRGMNTSGSNYLTLGWIPIPALMYGPWMEFFRSQNIEAYAIDNLGGGLLQEQTDRADLFLTKLKPRLSDGFHIVAHSAGGLVGWGLSSRQPWAGLVKSLTTLATPHQGSKMADLFFEFTAKQDFRVKALRSMGYNYQKRIPIFKEFTAQGVEEFKNRNRLAESFPLFSYSFSLNPEDMSWPLRITHQVGFKLSNLRHDGFIEVDSQRAGQHLSHWELDHSSQLGHHLYVDPRAKVKKMKLFNELKFDLIRHLQDVEKH